MDVRGGVETFTLVINYFIETWELMHVIVGLFKVNETTNFAWHDNYKHWLRNLV
jgi:hypothetical protein